MPTLILLVALLSSSQAPPGTPEIDVLPASTAMRKELPPSSAEARVEHGPRIAPWVILGGTIAAGVVAAIFATKTMDALDRANRLDFTVDIDPETHTATFPDEFRQRQDAVFQNGLVTTILSAVASAGLVSTIALFLGD